MNSRTLKLLTASTAFVAVASAGHAAAISSTTTAAYYTSSSTAGLLVTGTGSIISSGVPAIEISNTLGAANTISVSTGGIIQSGGATQTSATIMSTNVANALVTINNSGTIAAVGGTAKAMDFTGDVNGATIRNAGTVSGSITFGNGTNTLSSTGTISGTINGGTGADNYTFTGATQNGNVILGDGTNSAVVNASSTIRGNLVGGGGADTINISNSTVTGAVDVGAGADHLNISNSTIGSIAGATGAAMVSLTDASVNGVINLGGTNDGDELTIKGTKTFTTGGNISNVEFININTNAVFNHTVTDVTDLTVAAGKTLTANQQFATANLFNNGTTNINQDTNITGGLTNSGTLNIAAGKSVGAGTYTGTGTVGVGISSTTSAGNLVLTGTNEGAAVTSLTINVGDKAGYIADGTSYTIVDSSGSGTSSVGAITNSSTGVYRFSTAVSNGDVSLTINRVATASVVEGEDNKAAANALDTNTTNTNAALTAVHSLIGQQNTAAGVENVVQSLTPSIDGVGMAAANITVDTGNQVSNRLASLRSTSGIATGDGLANNHMWVQGFGSTVSQDNKGGNAGYDATAGGISMGVDTDTLVDGFNTGIAVSYGHGKVDSNSSSNASTDIDSYVATIYASQVFDNGAFLNSIFAGGYNKYDMTRNVIGVGTATGNTDGFQGSAKFEAGQDFALGGLTLTPLTSLQYTYLTMDKYTETGAGGASLTVDPDDLTTLDLSLGGQLAYNFALADGSTLKPSIHARYIYRMGDREMGTTSSFTGGTGSFNTNGVEADRSSVNLGAGLLLTTVAGTDLSVNYDADIRSSLTGHTGQMKARWAF